MKDASRTLWGLLLLTLVLAAPTLADCPDAKINCWGVSPDTGKHTQICGQITVPSWYQYAQLACDPCVKGKQLGDDIQGKCHEAFPKCCTDGGKTCWFYWKAWQGSSCLKAQDGWRPPY